MGKRILSNKAKLCAVILIVSLGFVSAESVANNTATEFSAVSPNDIPDILTMISEKTHSNYERIKTWQGEIDATVNAICEGLAAKRILQNKRSCAGKNAEVVREHRRSKIEFVADCEQNFFYAKKTRQNPRQYIDVKTGKILCERSVPWYQASIGTPEYQINCRPDSKRGDSIATRKAIKKAAERNCASCSSDVFDPREFFLAIGPLWETFPRMIKIINEHGEYGIDGYTLKVEERTDERITEYRIQIPGRVSPEQYLFITMIFSSEKEFNIISLETTRTDGKLFQRKTWEYELVDGAYLPSKTTKQDFTGENAKLTYKRECIFRNLQINHSIPPETFTYKNLGLKNGDKFIDKILGREYTYQDEELIQASSGSSYMLKQTDPIKNLNKHCKHCRHKWKRLIILASHWLDS